MLKGHGDDAYAFASEVTANFSSNIYDSRDFAPLYAHLANGLPTIHSYPEPDAHSLAAEIAGKHHIDEDEVCITNGATEGIYLIAQAFRKCKSTIIIPTFSEYEDACRIHEHDLRFHTTLGADMFPTDLVWICNPNNPDGCVYDLDVLEQMVIAHPDTIFICDQSYEKYTRKKVWQVKQALQHKNLILIHSMTKQYAIPGLRLGYITAHSDLIERVSAYRMPWSVNTLAIQAGLFLLQHMAEDTHSDAYLEETARLQTALSQLNGLTVFPSDTHFFICKLEHRKASTLKAHLMEEYGILIRDAANFRGLDAHYFRIATQSPKENNCLINAIRKWL